MSAWVIWKFPLPTADVTVGIPAGGRVLTVQEQQGDLCLWALVDPDAPRELRRFRIHGTGHPLEDPGEYVGTAQTHLGTLVWHVFEATLV